MKIILAMFVILIATPAFGQQIPMPTVAQCRADRDAWADIEPINDSQSALPEHRLEEMVLEMSQCANTVDGKGPSTKAFDGYNKVFTNIMGCVYARYMDFVLRHPEIAKKFKEEDAAGAR
jgi:hypothetical protein